ncbi:MAG: tetratricopeptide repeat protein [Spirochaetes bacterium]|nr:tetratricopeptide repeat protein [Spirochaetota bacterium]
MTEAEEISYTPEEIEEIERIVDLVSKSGRKIVEVREPAPAAVAAAEDEYHTAPGSFREPEDLDLPPIDFDHLDAGEKAAPAGEGAVPLEDITGILREVEDKFPEITTEPAPEPFEDLTLELDEVPEKAEPVPAPAVSEERLSPLDELDLLTKDEPESLDHADRAPADEFIADRGPARQETPVFEKPPAPGGGGAVPPVVEEESIPADMSVFDEIDLGAAPSAAPPEGVSIGPEARTDIPDLSEISFEEKVEMPETRAADVPAIDIPVEPLPAAPEAPSPSMDELTDEDMASLSDIDEFHKEPDIRPSKDIIDRVKKKEGAVKAAPPAPEALSAAEEPFEIEMLDEEIKPERPAMPAAPAPAPAGRGGGGEGIDLSERELKRLTRSILLFSAPVRLAVKDTVINDLLSPKDTRQLITMILGGASEADVHRFLDDKLKKTIPIGVPRAVPGRRVITARPEYSAMGRERQKRLATMTKIIGGSLAVVCVLGIVGYQFIFKPFMARRMISEGTALIRESGDYLKKPKDYAAAEKIFREVDENYAKDFAEGYRAYSSAYLDRKEYLFSIRKLNRLYAIQSGKGRAIELALLNDLGHFYSRVPVEFYSGIRLNINKWYYPGSDKKREEWSQLDVAIEFFRRVLARDRENVTALFGIGNAYFHQGQYFKAKKYYEDIVNLEPESEVGYSGLLNLYIERDVFEKVVEVHARLADRKMMEDVPSALLAKLASYYLDKQKSPTSNVRIDYGVQSARFKDADDNIFPAVYGVLEALNRRDRDYPPLHLQYARLNRAQNNLKLMKIHLEKAIKLSRDNYNAEYFGALHLLGEYYYQAREPLKAYETLNRAIAAAGNPPDFTRDDFYRETESPGKSYALLGNIFYYYFDKVRMRYGDLEDEETEEDADRLANYQIARDKYEKALAEGYESSEVHYNLGRVYYLTGLYRKALDQWLNLYEDFVEKPEIMFALGNAFYHMGSYDAAKGEYLKLISAYEYDMERMKIARRDLEGHVKLIRFLSAAYNNVGAVYQAQNNEGRSDISYWKAIDWAQQINSDNEFARVNLARSFKQTGGAGEPILDESIPYSLDYYREDLRR